MKDEELKVWFWDKFNSCYPVNHYDYPGSIFWFYDDKVCRKIKLCKLDGKEFSQVNITGRCLFQQDFKNDRLWCDYIEIWSFIEMNCSRSYTGVQKFIKSLLVETTKLSVTTPIHNFKQTWCILEDITNLSIIAPLVFESSSIFRLEESTKLSVLTPSYPLIAPIFAQEESTKLSVLTNTKLSFTSLQ